MNRCSPVASNWESLPFYLFYKPIIKSRIEVVQHFYHQMSVDQEKHWVLVLPLKSKRTMHEPTNSLLSRDCPHHTLSYIMVQVMVVKKQGNWQTCWWKETPLSFYLSLSFSGSLDCTHRTFNLSIGCQMFFLSLSLSLVHSKKEMQTNKKEGKLFLRPCPPPATIFSKINYHLNLL